MPIPWHVWEKPTLDSFESGWEIWKSVIAAVGYCLGYGLTVLTWCDFGFASQRAEFGYPEVNLGRLAIVGAIRLPQRLRWHDAMVLLLTGERLVAATAHDIGLVGRVVPHDQLLVEGRRLADWPVNSAPLARRAMKEVAVRSRSLPPLEAIRFGETMRKVAEATAEAVEGGQAVRERQRRNGKDDERVGAGNRRASVVGPRAVRASVYGSAPRIEKPHGHGQSTPLPPVFIAIRTVLDRDARCGPHVTVRV